MSPETDRSGVAQVRRLTVQYEREVEVDPRAAAETAYALAFLYRDHDVDGRRRFDLAKDWALRSIRLLADLPSNAVHDVASTRQSVGGIQIPDLLHSGVVAERLSDVLA